MVGVGVAGWRGSGTLSILLLFPGLRRFVYLVWRDAGCRAQLIPTVITLIFRRTLKLDSQ